MVITYFSHSFIWFSLDYFKPTFLQKIGVTVTILWKSLHKNHNFLNLLENQIMSSNGQLITCDISIWSCTMKNEVDRYFHKNGSLPAKIGPQWKTAPKCRTNSIQCDAISAFSSKLRFLNSWLKSGPWDVVFEKTMMYCRCFLSKALPSFSFQSSSPSIFWWFASLAHLLLRKNPIS